MIKNIVHTIVILSCYVSFLNAQNNTTKGYRIEGDELVFSFNAHDYDYFSNDVYNDRLEVSEVFINTVAVAGEFNNWSRDAWLMQRLNNGTYELRKKLSEFMQNFDWEFKFVINKNYWAEPNAQHTNVAPAKDRYGDPLHVYNLRLFTAYPLEKGNATFRLKGYTNAKEVILSGTFNRWNETLFKMKRTADGWQLTLQLKPDRYLYKFIVDGHWIEDPNNPDKVLNEYNGFNSAISIKTNASFYLEGFNDARQVYIAGSFNDWNTDNCPMIKTENGWKFSTQLSGGKHHYKYIVDGAWMVDPHNPVKEYDGKGNINSVIMIK